MDHPLRILIVEDSEDDALLLIRKIKQGQYMPVWVRVDNEADMRKNLNEKEWDIVISDFSMPAFDGLTALKVFNQMDLDVSFILVSGTIGEELAVKAMREGAHDYLMKDNLERLVPAIRRELRETQMRRERSRALALLKEREEILTRIIENIPFMKERGEGTGMGLSVVHGIIKDMGGSISVTSQPGQGTTFKILIPRYGGKPVANGVSNRTTKFGSGNILIVDDEILITTSICGILDKIGCHVVSTTNPFKALNIFKTRADEFDLVLTDMTMPKMTGLELAEHLLQIRPDISIVMFTGYSPGITSERLKKAGIKKMLTKPFVASELANTVHAVFYPEIRQD